MGVWAYGGEGASREIEAIRERLAPNATQAGNPAVIRPHPHTPTPPLSYSPTLPPPCYNPP